MAPRTLTSDETPTITASATAPASDADAAAQRVVLCGGSALGGSTTELAQAQRDELRRWIGGVNWGLRPYWNGYSYRVSNSIATPNGSTSNGNQGNMQPSPGAGLSPQWGIQLTGAGAYLDAVLDGDVLFVPGFLHAISLWVNDKLVNVAPGTGVAGTVSNTVYTSTVGGGVSYIKVKFPSVARRNIRVGWVLDKGIGDLYLRSAHDVRPRFASRPTVLMIGDSFCDTGGSDVKFCVAGQMMAQLGPAWDLVTGSVGGTGYGQADTKANFATRVQAMDVPLIQSPAAVLIVAGQNDSAAQITASAPDVLSGLRALFPRAPIFIITTYGPNSYGTAQARQDAIEAASAAVTQCHVIRTYGATAYGGKSWVYGTGKVGATTGDGNADRYVSSDGTHPPDAGHLHWSGLFSGGIAALCRSDTVTF